MAADPAPQTHGEGSLERTLRDGSRDRLVAEEPLLLQVHDQPLLTMRTPGMDRELAIGFLLGEGVIHAADEVAALRALPADPARQRVDELHVDLRQAPGQDLRRRLARTHEIRSSCGACGLSDPAQVLEQSRPLLPGVPVVSWTTLNGLGDQMRARQELFAATGGCHAALVADDSGVRGFGEDVGRHNALDKAIGMAALAGADLSRCVALLSGRAGYDLVVKCLRARIAVIASVSAPSALAFDLCHLAGATLIGFLRQGGGKVYCDGGARLRG